MIKKFRVWLLALVLGVGLAGQVNATVYNVGDLTGPDFYFNSASFASGAAIDDTYNFSILGGSTFSSILSSIELFNIFNISNFVLHLTGPALNATYAAGGPGPEFISTGNLLLIGGAYAANVTGLVTGTAGGLYQIQMATAPLAVPEPSGWMMLLAGLALVGFMAKRRSDLI